MERLPSLRDLVGQDIAFWTEALPRALPIRSRVRSFGFRTGRRNEVRGPNKRFALAFITSGSGILEIAGKSWPVQAPCLIFHLPDEAYRAVPKPAWEEFFVTYMPGEPLFAGGRIPLASLPRVVSFAGADFILDYARIILDLFLHIRDYGAGDRLDRLAESLIIEAVCRRYEKPADTAPLDNPPLQTIYAIRNHIDRHLAEELDFDQLAAGHGMSPRHCRRLWRQEFKLSPLQYLHEQRLKQARYLLEYSNLRIKQIAVTVGYANEFYFTRRFTATVGRSPKDYRQAISSVQERLG